MSLPRNVSKDCNGRWNLIKEKPAIIRESSIIRILQAAICIFPVQILIYCYPLNGISLFILYAITLFETLLFYHGGIGARNKKSEKLAVTGSIFLFLKILEKPFPLFFYLFNRCLFFPSLSLFSLIDSSKKITSESPWIEEVKEDTKLKTRDKNRNANSSKRMSFKRTSISLCIIALYVFEDLFSFK